jgi:hypothetical protein
VALSVIDMHIFENLVSVDDVLRFKVFLDIHRLFVAQGKRIIVQWPAERLPDGDVLNSPSKQVIRTGLVPSLDLSHQVIRSGVNVGHDVGLPVRVLLSRRVRERSLSFAYLVEFSAHLHHRMEKNVATRYETKSTVLPGN